MDANILDRLNVCCDLYHDNDVNIVDLVNLQSVLLNNIEVPYTTNVPILPSIDPRSSVSSSSLVSSYRSKSFTLLTGTAIIVCSSLLQRAARI